MRNAPPFTRVRVELPGVRSSCHKPKSSSHPRARGEVRVIFVGDEWSRATELSWYDTDKENQEYKGRALLPKMHGEFFVVEGMTRKFARFD